MDNKDKFLLKLYEILATLEYNSERTEILEEILKKFLITRDTNINIKKESEEIFNEIFFKRIDKSKNFDIEIKKGLFKQKSMLLSNIPTEYVLEYLIGKFSPFAKLFEKRYDLNFDSIWLFAFKLTEYLEFKKYFSEFKDEIYRFKSKDEYANPKFVSLPSKDYTQKWRNVVTFSIDEIKRIFPICGHDTDKCIEILSFSIKDINDTKEFNFHLKPFLKIDNDTLILLTPYYLIRALPTIYEFLFKRIKKYTTNKGKSFERLVQNTIKQLHFRLLAYNIEYQDGDKTRETDAVIRFDNSVWFVEATSHPLSERALNGDWKAIEDDLKKTIKKCITQGENCLNNLDKEPLKTFSENIKVRGIMVVLDGIYPQLNVNTLFTFHNKPYPVYIINWFDLRLLLEQPEIDLFEKFLLWRTVNKPMPVICFDEKDYWAFYFDRYLKDKKIRDGFEIMQKNEDNLFYISYRFNNKDYLKNLV